MTDNPDPSRGLAYCAGIMLVLYIVGALIWSWR